MREGLDTLTGRPVADLRPESTSPLQGVRRLNDDLFRAVSDARERGVTRQQIKLRLQDQMAAFEDVDIESEEAKRDANRCSEER
jgi:hypothetical protein